MIVADTSAVLAGLSGSDQGARVAERLVADRDLHAPHLIDLEMLHALRRMLGRSEVTLDRAEAIRGDFADLRVKRYPHQFFADRIWELRHNLTAYDACFVSLAEALDCPLVTCDARIAGAPGHHATVEVFDP